MTLFLESPSTFINGFLLKGGLLLLVYSFNYNKIFRISTDLELRDVSHVKMILNATVRKGKLNWQPLPENTVNLRKIGVHFFVWLIQFLT